MTARTTQHLLTLTLMTARTTLFTNPDTVMPARTIQYDLKIRTFFPHGLFMYFILDYNRLRPFT